LSVSTMPPLPVVMTIDGAKDITLMAPLCPAGRSSHSEPMA